MLFRHSGILDLGPGSGPGSGLRSRFCPVRSIVPWSNMPVLWSERAYWRLGRVYRAPPTSATPGYQRPSDRPTDRPTDQPLLDQPLLDQPLLDQPLINIQLFINAHLYRLTVARALKEHPQQPKGTRSQCDLAALRWVRDTVPRVAFT